MFKIEKDWIHKVLRCVVIARDTGNRCGYVGVSEMNALYGLGYSDSIDISDEEKEELMKSPIGKRSPIQLLCFDENDIRVESVIDVHGGLTYSSSYFKNSYPVLSDVWWFGYDCAHYGDGKDFDIMSDKYKEIEQKYGLSGEGPIRDLNYCISECESLADQLLNFNIVL